MNNQMRNLSYAPLQFGGPFESPDALGSTSASSPPASPAESFFEEFGHALRDLPTGAAPVRFGPPQRYLMDSIALGANGKRDQEAMFAFGKQGGTYEAWANNMLRDRAAAAGAALAGNTAHLDDDQFGKAYADLQRQLGQRPEAKPDPKLKGPSTLQLAAGGLFALLAPKYAALALAAPFQSQLRQHGFDVERTRSENADAYGRWRDGLDDAAVPMGFGAPERTGASTLRGGELPRAPATEAMPLGTGAADPKGAVDRSASIRRLWSSGKLAAASAEAYDIRGELVQSRPRWIEKSQADRVAKGENDAEYSRRKAYDMAAGTRQRASTASLTTLLARLEDARGRTSQELESLQAQEAALSSLAERGPVSRADDLERIRTLKMVRLDDLRRLGGLYEQTRSRLETMPSSPRSTPGTPPTRPNRRARTASASPAQGWRIVRKE